MRCNDNNPMTVLLSCIFVFSVIATAGYILHDIVKITIRQEVRRVLREEMPSLLEQHEARRSPASPADH